MASPSAPSAGPSSTSAEFVRDNYIPVFDNKPSSYREYRQRLMLYFMKLLKRTSEATINLLTSLTGTAWARVEHLSETAPDKENGFDLVLAELDKAFRYDNRVEMPRAIDKYFYALQRRPDQTLLQYTGEARDAVRELEKHGIALPSEVQGYILLKKSGLSPEQKQLILSQVGAKLTPDKIEESMFFLLGQDHKAAARQPPTRTWHRGGSKSASSGTWRRSYGSAHLDPEVYEEDAQWQDDGYLDALEPEKTEYTYYEDIAQDDDEAYEEAYASYIDARRRLADVKASRGFFPVATTCLRCGQPGHWASQCPMPPSSSPSVASSPSKRPRDTVRVAADLPCALDSAHAVDAALVVTEDGNLVAQQDGGASAMLGGHRPVMQAISHLLSKGVSPANLALQVRTDFELDLCSVLGGEPTAALLGPGGEFMLQLDEGLDSDSVLQPLAFDLVTEELATLASPCDPRLPLLTLADYLADTGREGPDVDLAFSTASAPDADSAPALDSPSAETSVDPSVHAPVLSPVTPKLLKSLEVSARQAVNATNKALEEALWSSPATPPVFWEVYSGTGNLSAEMTRRGFDVRTFDLPEWDFTKPSERRRFLNLLHHERPHVVWLAPPCPLLWSPLQNLTSSDSYQQEILELDRQLHHASHLKLSRRVFDFQLSTGHVAVIEYPKTSLAWRTPAFRGISGWAATLDLCAVDARLPNQHGRLTPIKKATRLQVTHPELCEMLSIRCPGHSFHLPLVGQSPRIGSRSAAAAAYQPTMCRKLADALQTAVDVALARPVFEKAFAGGSASASSDIPAVDSSAPPPAPVSHTPERAADEPAVAPAAPSEPDVVNPHRNTGVLEQLLTERPAEAQRIVARLHKNLGHPSRDQMVEQLRARGSSNALLQAAHDYVCPTCAQLAPPNQLPKVRFALPQSSTSASWLTPFG
ncbi:GIP [Symbiodinium natans]|uniref:GIP protein n=1 Tax=Symbiodinium natans TaxID=878477 RepID=A0A812SLC9_9DINO|nr:GIP [Symbiodinium natans]